MIFWIAFAHAVPIVVVAFATTKHWPVWLATAVMVSVAFLMGSDRYIAQDLLGVAAGLVLALLIVSRKN